jgi:hypothetical protein
MEISRSRERMWVSVYRVYGTKVQDSPSTLGYLHGFGKTTHRFVGVPDQLVCLKHQHVHKRCLAMVQVPHNSNIAYHFRERHHVQQKTSIGAECAKR